MNLAKIWSTALGTMQVQTSRQEFNTWLRNAALLSVDNGIATIGVLSPFLKEGVENRYTGPLRDLLTDLVGFPVKLRVVIVPATRIEQRQPEAEPPAPAATTATAEQAAAPVAEEVVVAAPAATPPSAPPTNANGSPKSMPVVSYPANQNYHNGSSSMLFGGNGSSNGMALERRPMQQLDLSSVMRSGMLNARYTFDRFIIGPSNRLASAACMAVAEQPAQAYNPLFLYGGVGLGKTHLLHAIGNYALDRDPEITVMYVSSEKFTNDLINAIRRQQTEEFRLRYRSIDILLIDDIQFIAGKESTQEEFFHTFNTLHAAGKQVVISSDRPPKAILTLEERLRSRFEGGLIVDVQLPDVETRTAILRAKAEQMALPVPAEVIDFLAQRIQSNIRELEGYMNRVVVYAQMYGTEVSVEVATNALSDLLDSSRRKRISNNAILQEVANFYGVDLRALQGRGRSRNIVIPRQVAMYLLREETDSSLVDIGKALGGRDHTTIMYGCDKISENQNTDSRLRQEVNTIRDRLYQNTIK